MKNLSKVVTFFIAVLLLSSCGDSNVARLKKEVDQLNLNCPISLGVVGNLTGASYDDDNSGNVHYSFALSDDLQESLDDNIVKGSILLSLSGEDENSREFLKLMVDAGAGLDITYRSQQEPRAKDINITAEEIKNRYENPISTAEMYERLYALQLKQQNAACPFEVDNGIMMKTVYDDGSNLVYVGELDEDIYDVEYARDNIGGVRQGIASTFNDISVKGLIKMLVSMNKWLIYRYIGDESGVAFDVVFTNADLEKYI
jgi:hypothetical protein